MTSLFSVSEGVIALVFLATACVAALLGAKVSRLKMSGERDRLAAELEREVRLRHEALDEQRRYRSLAEALPQIVWTAGTDGAVDYCNARWFDYTGMTFEQTQNDGWAWGLGWGPVLHPDDLANCAQAWQDSIGQGTPYEVEFRFKRARDGAYRWHIARASPVRDAAGTIVKWFGTCTDIDDQKRASEAAGRLSEEFRLNDALKQDISARKRAEAALRASEELFRQVEEHAPIGLALVALSGNFMRVNPALCAITGNSSEQLLSTNFQLLMHPDDLEADLAYVGQSLEGKIGSFEMEERYLLKDGQIVWILLNVSLVRVDGGEACYFIRQMQDISQRKAAEQAVKEAQHAALAGTEAKSRFLATMSHEIRTPMNGIIGMTELLSLSQLNDEQAEYVKVVRDSGRSLLRVLNDILDYSKIEAGRLDLETMDFEVASQIESVIALLNPQFKTKGVTLGSQVESGVPDTLRGDPGRLRQILINLVGNALKFTPAGGDVTVRVSRESASPDGPSAIRFTVTDAGIGIAPEVRDRLFLPFSQIDGSTTRKYGGTGLGLSICKQLVDLMGGRIGVDSALGSGSSFWFTVPFLPAGRALEALPGLVREIGDRRAAVRPRPEKLLLAEDNVVNALLAMRQLKSLGFEVKLVPDGRAAVAAVQSEHFELVFMDWHMPEMDGLDATRAIRALPSDIQQRVTIIAITADAQAEDKQTCLAAGMDDFISKPATLADLSTVLTRWLPSAVADPTAIHISHPVAVHVSDR